MKVMLIEPLGDGGISHYTFNLANALAREKMTISLFTAVNYEFPPSACLFSLHRAMFPLTHRLVRRFPSLATEYGVKNYVRKAMKLLEYPLGVAEALSYARRNRIDIVHIQTIHDVELLMILAFRVSGWKICLTIHNVRPRHSEPVFLQRLIYRWMCSLCHRVIIHSRKAMEEAIALYRVPKEKITVLPHGNYAFFVKESTKRTAREAKEALGIPHRNKAVLFFGAIRPNKGLDVLLRAMSKITERMPNITLLIIGEPCEDYRRYRSLIEALALRGHIIEKLGYVPNDDIPIYFEAADLVALPYKEVTQSGVLQLAYAFSKPVVATRTGGFEETVESGKNGYLVPSNDVTALASAIEAILSDDGRRESMGRQSRLLCETEYSWDAIARKTRALYASIG